MWFKKKSVLQTEGHYNSSISVNGNDWRTDTNGNYDMWPAFNTLPSAADAGNYFYLPALGVYASGQLYDAGNAGWYWSSSAYPWYSNYAYSLYFRSGLVYVYNIPRYNGMRVEPMVE